MENGKQRKRQLSPEEKWEVFLEVTSQELSQADAARKWGVDVSTVIRIRQLAKDAALAAFAASKPGRSCGASPAAGRSTRPTRRWRSSAERASPSGTPGMTSSSGVQVPCGG
jgi:transposase-like protein